MIWLLICITLCLYPAWYIHSVNNKELYISKHLFLDYQLMNLIKHCWVLWDQRVRFKEGESPESISVYPIMANNVSTQETVLDDCRNKSTVHHV